MFKMYTLIIIITSENRSSPHISRVKAALSIVGIVEFVMTYFDRNDFSNGESSLPKIYLSVGVADRIGNPDLSRSSSVSISL